jgi:Transglutaminase-like superfamily
MLRLARDVVRLSAADRRLAARALLWLAVVRGAMRVCSYPRARHLLARIPPRHSSRAGAGAEDCARAIRRAARVLPSSTCLSRALAGATLLRREGRSCVLTIHVGFDTRQRFEAHASLAAQGVIVTGGGAGAEWQVLASEQLQP